MSRSARRRDRRERRERREKATQVPRLPWRNLTNPYPPIEVLSADQIEAIHAASLRVLAEIGMKVLSQSARDRLAVAGAEVNEADRLVLCPGAWAADLLPEVARRAGLHVVRKTLLWLPRRDGDTAAPTSTFFVELPYGGFYGFPCLDGETVKLAEHTGGDPVEDPLALDRALKTSDVENPARFVDTVLRSST